MSYADFSIYLIGDVLMKRDQSLKKYKILIINFV